jgi:hypothetical protein
MSSNRGRELYAYYISARNRVNEWTGIQQDALRRAEDAAVEMRSHAERLLIETHDLAIGISVSVKFSTWSLDGAKNINLKTWLTNHDWINETSPGIITEYEPIDDQCLVEWPDGVSLYVPVKYLEVAT